MPLQYCYKIKNTNKLDWDKIKEYIRKLYDKKKKVEKLPLLVFPNENDNQICIRLKGMSKKNVSEIERIHKNLKAKDLTYGKVKFSKPELFVLEVAQKVEIRREGKKWNSIVQSGPYFPHLMEPYKSLNSYLTYDGKKYKLSEEVERYAVLWADLLYKEGEGKLTEIRTKDPVFRKNFWSDFKKILGVKDFKKIDWKDLVKKVKNRAEKNKDLTEKQKREKNEKNRAKECKYGFAKLDGNVEKLDSYSVELAGLFRGRGEHPKRGKIKTLVNPEDVELNLAITDPIPRAPKGHKWGNIINDHTATWLARWNDALTGKKKYIRFGKTGKLKAESNLCKFYKVRKLQRNIESIRKKYMENAKSSNTKKSQLGTVLWLIDNYGIRAGGEKSSDEASTVGASTLKVENVKIKGDIVTFDFLGKDSIRYKQDIKIDNPTILKNFKRFVKDKERKVDLFDKITVNDINLYLKSFDKDFTAKVFRTRLASFNMFTELEKLKVSKNTCKTKGNVGTIKGIFAKANTVVAKILNHVKNVTSKAKEATKKKEAQLKAKKKELKTKKKEGKKVVSLEKTIKNLQQQIKTRKLTQNVALTTSMNNYIDPRIVVAWTKSQCEKEQEKEAMKPIKEIIYTKQQQDSFKWAFDSNKNWNWLTSPLIGSEKLVPENKVNVKKAKAKVKVKAKVKMNPKPKVKVDVKKVEIKPRRMKNDILNISQSDIKILTSFCKNFSKKTLLSGLNDKTWHLLYKLITKKGKKETLHSKAILDFYKKIF